MEDWELGEEYWSSPNQSGYYNMQDLLFGNDFEVDTHAQDLMWDVVTSRTDSSWRNFSEYMMDVYDIDVEIEWDWHDFVEWYKGS